MLVATDIQDMPTKGWKPHFFRAGQSSDGFDNAPGAGPVKEFRKAIEPWLSALFQSEHLSLLLGSGFTLGVAGLAETTATRMEPLPMPAFDLAEVVTSAARRTAAASGRTNFNVEDQIRTLSQLATGLEILKDERQSACESMLQSVLLGFFHSICSTESALRSSLVSGEGDKSAARKALISFLLSFAARSAGRERLHVFTTNYDRLIEFGCDTSGLRIVDRFVGGLTPMFRSSRLDVDFHYNPPGIRGEPRYLEGVLRLTKLHGSIDWRLDNGVVVKHAVPFGLGAKDSFLTSSPLTSVMVYPNAAKDVDTSMYPYAELFRDFSGALCRPNSVLVVYGYGFGDEHINRVLRDMLTIPSTHVVIASYDDAQGRIQAFCESAARDAQISLLIGSHFADFGTLVSRYLPKPAIDQIALRQADLIRRRTHTSDSADATSASASEQTPQADGSTK